MENIYGLLGKKLSHSFSKKYFTDKFQELSINNSQYLNFEIEEINLLKKIIVDYPNIKGLNVTIPYKESVINLLDELSEEVKIIGAVNTIKISWLNNKAFLKGYNTDAYGFAQSIKPFLDYNHQRALILGNGGAAKAVKYVLNNLGIDYIVISRNPDRTKNELAYSDLNEYAINQNKFIINTTPLGMYPNENDYPDIPYAGISNLHLCVDLIYNPEKTIFLQKSENQGSKILNGLTMLKMQAEKAWEIWNSNL
jgi:shikimate dehydrogenase